LFFVVTLGLRVFAEGFWRDPRTSPLVTLDDVSFTLRIITPAVVIMVGEALTTMRRRRSNG